ncbi:MAG TPA: hypothetical protein VME86_04575 [Acidobacteriaceae bacterium]|nr:hypothetical protein [Acidobacteriaceae bacterium]
MLPRDLKDDSFTEYPPQARKLAVAHLAVLQELPLSFLPSFLRQLIDYDYKFPAERSAIDAEVKAIGSLSPKQLDEWFNGFAHISLSSKMERIDWVNRPTEFLEQESAYLWTTGQLDAFRRAAIAYGNRLQAVAPAEHIPTRRLGIAIIGQGVTSYDGPLFRDLRANGTYFEHIEPENGLQMLLAAAEARAQAHSIPYGHWYVDGGEEAKHSSLVTGVSYASLKPVRSALLKFIDKQIAQPGMGPEELRTRMARLQPSELGMDKDGDPVLDRFEVKLFTEGSGTQIFSTTFAMWTAREALRRAQPLTLLVRYAPRQTQRPMNALLTNSDKSPELDYLGSLVDADMGSYYHWINQQRLTGAEQSTFLAWFEGHRQAVVVSPTLPRGVESSSAMNLGELLKLAMS